jgi:asparagine synthase (glutamine-hydrolysing)
MCGISGFAHRDPGRPINKQMLSAMTDIIRHRGPDGEGFYSGPGVGLGFRRLSIIDLETGDQPIVNEDGSLVLICNGEIYNYEELRAQLVKRGHHFRTRSDAETILHLYEEHEADCLKYLRGMFAFALWDKNRRRLFLARDRLGIKPLHYAIGQDETLYFGSEQKSILMADRIDRSVDPRALHDLFTFGFILTPRTLFRKIRHLPPGHYLFYHGGKVSVTQYWDLFFPENRDGKTLSEATWAEALLEKLKEVVAMHMRSDVPVGAWLSAGIDSSAVAALMRHISGQPVQTLSLAFENHPGYNEFDHQTTLDKFPEYASSNERIIFTDRHFDLFSKALWHAENPTSSGTRISRMALSEATARRFKVVLTGEGSDEIFGGYPWYGVDKACRPFAVLPKCIRKLMLLGPVIPARKPWSSGVFMAPRKMDLKRFALLIGSFHRENIITDLFSDHWRRETLKSGDEYSDMTAFPAFQRWHNFEKIQYMDTKTRLVDFIVLGLDRSSMAYSLETRVPFLDHELVELCAQIPPGLKMKYLKEKYILRKALKNHLPPVILRRKKRGLATPHEPWLAGSLPEPVAALLSETQLKEKGYFKASFVRQLLTEHRSRRKNYSRALMAILSVQAWDDLFMKEKQTMDISEGNGG